MNNIYRFLSAALIGVSASATVLSAPLDVLLTANQPTTPGNGELEISYDAANNSLDFMNLREKNGSISNVGDYKGEHLRGGIAITPQLWVDGALWRREIDYRSFLADLTTWQIAGQYKFLEGAGYSPSVALRLGAWGNYSDSLTKSTNTTLAGTKFTTATVTKPQDLQFQLNAVGTWTLTPQVEFSLFGGGGTSRTSYDTISATSRTANGCEYNIAFVDAGTISTLARPCTAAVVISRYSQSISKIDVNKEAKYKAYYYQIGFMTAWTVNDWRIRGGYQYQSINRHEIDELVESRGTMAYKNNQILIADVSYKVLKNATVFLRGQFMKNQFNGEIPLAYNTLTADRFGQRYGILSTGVTFSF
jgi:hypothetical protein